MTWLNEYDVEDVVNLFTGYDETPNLAQGARQLAVLVSWTNSNSDGWPYWPKPSRAAAKLQQLLHDAHTAYRRGGPLQDITPAQLRAALAPVKAFRTRQGADFQLV